MKYFLNLIVIIAIGALIYFGNFFKKDNYENITIYTTQYPVTYITEKLYKDYSKIESIYPNGADLESYVITNKKLNDYSKGNLFIYNGLTNEKQVAASLLSKNKKIDIIDVSKGLELKDSQTELWLSPSNFLMMAQNIKNGLKEYITNKTIIDSVEENYEDLKVKVSELDAELKLIAENSANNRIIVANNSFKFLEKYGFEVISIAENDENSNTNISKAENAYTAKENTYLFEIKGTEETETIKTLVEKGATKIDIIKMDTLTDEEIKNGNDYLSILTEFIENIKKEAY